MRKSVLFVLILIFTSIVNPISFVNTTQEIGSTIEGRMELIYIGDSTSYCPNKISYENETWAQWTTTAFAPDGDITEWDTEGIISETFGGADVYLAYDATNAYVAITWFDFTYSTSVCEWNKTDANDGFEILPGADDIITVGFHDGIDTDLWTWTASNRTADDFAFEHDGDGNPDTGTLPFIMNTNGTDFTTPNAPFWDNTWNPIADYSLIPFNTQITGWYPDETVPTGSQADVAVGWDYTSYKYTIEFVRALDTGNGDDIVLDFTNNDLWFEIAIEDQNEAYNFDISTCSHLIFHQNTPAELTFDEPPEFINETLLLTGTVFDDYSDYTLTIYLDTWYYTWIPPTDVIINQTTGEWSYLLEYNDEFAPLGETNITVTLTPRYDEEIVISYISDVVDEEAPDIFRVYNITDTYPFGVPGDTGQVLLSTGIVDNYDEPDNLIVYLLHYKDLGTAISEPMRQSSPGSHTFYGSIEIDPTDDYTVVHEYHYTVQVSDLSSNVEVSKEYVFRTMIGSNIQTTTTTTPILAIPIGSIFSTVFLIGCIAVFVKQKRK